MADIEVTATRPFLHGRIRARAGDVFRIPEREARDLERAGLVRRTGGNAPELIAKKAVPVPNGPPAPLFVLPPAPLLLPETSTPSGVGDSLPKRRGRPPGSRNKPRGSGASSSPT